MKVFVSYSHDSPDQMNRVLALCDRLRADGVDCIIDQYLMSPAEGWPRWTAARIEKVKYVLVICTETYGRRFRGEEQWGKGLGANWEGAVITQNLYDVQVSNDKFIPVLFRTDDATHIPTVLRGATRYDLSTDDGYESLYRRLTNQPGVTMPPLGKLVPLPALERKQEFTTQSEGSEGETTNSGIEGEPRVERAKLRAKTKLIALLTIPTVLGVIILVVLFNWRVPTHIRANLTANRVSFTLGGTERMAILNSLGLKSLVMEKFAQIKFKAESLTPLAGSIHDSKDGGRLREKLVTNSQTVTITARDERFLSNVNIAGIAGAQLYPLTMGDVRAAPNSEITLEITEDAYDLILRIDGQHSAGNITSASPITISMNQCEISGIGDYPSGDQALTFLAKLSSDSPIEFDGQPDSLVLTLTVPAERITSLFPKGNIPITAIRFERQNEQNDKIISSLLKDGELYYPGYERIDKRKITSTEFASLNGLDKFSIEEIKLDPAERGVKLTLQGVASKIMTGSSDFKVDQRLTAYDVISHNYQVLSLFGVACWIFGTSVGAYKLSREQD
jgi:SEFIR domain